mmetsp:Transcript_43597/g.109994  ORF Transcript_43597/g.109994 Transcript_43597/m.109994 type:complete len:239 (+) Transcript_43597:286-1002(+)
MRRCMDSRPDCRRVPEHNSLAGKPAVCCHGNRAAAHRHDSTTKHPIRRRACKVCRGSGVALCGVLLHFHSAGQAAASSVDRVAVNGRGKVDVLQFSPGVQGGDAPAQRAACDPPLHVLTGCCGPVQAYGARHRRDPGSRPRHRHFPRACHLLVAPGPCGWVQKPCVLEGEPGADAGGAGVRFQPAHCRCGGGVRRGQQGRRHGRGRGGVWLVHVCGQGPLPRDRQDNLVCHWISRRVR